MFNLPFVELYREAGLKLGVMRKPDLLSLKTKGWDQQGCHTVNCTGAIHMEWSLNNIPQSYDMWQPWEVDLQRGLLDDWGTEAGVSLRTGEVRSI